MKPTMNETLARRRYFTAISAGVTLRRAPPAHSLRALIKCAAEGRKMRHNRILQARGYQYLTY